MTGSLCKRKSKTSDLRAHADETAAPGSSDNAVALADQPEGTPASASSAKPYGIKVFHEGTDAVVDIVFIHGLTGHRDKTWTAKHASKPWPSPLLHDKLLNARLLSFGYDSEVVKWKEMVSRNRLENHARNLLSALAAHREETDTEDRNLIFVCHSLGGLLCENAMVVARNNTGEEHLHQIFTCTRGILFLGTPHCGSDLAKWGSMFSSLLGAVKQTNPDIVNVLKENSEVLAVVQKAFHEMLRTRNKSDTIIEITCCHEELPLPGIGIVVPEHSAVLPGYIAISIPENHMEMTKFSSSEDSGFKTVTSELRRWIKRLSKKREDDSSAAVPQLHGPSLHAAGLSGKERIVMLPEGRNGNYVARDQAMKALVDALYPQFAATQTDTHTRIALYGLGGTGKTQIAIQFAHDAVAAFPLLSVFWLQASSKESFVADYIKIGRVTNLPTPSNTQDMQSLAEIRGYLESTESSPWLLIIDNADDDDVFSNDDDGLSTLIPSCTHGSLLITSRNKQAALHLTLNRKLVEVGPMSVDKCMDLVCRSMPDVVIDEQQSKDLAKQLGYLPLALVRATAYIRKESIALKEYFDLFRKEQDLVRLLSQPFQEHGRDDVTIPNAVATTWLISFSKIQKRQPAAIDALSLISQLYQARIPSAIVEHYFSRHGAQDQRQSIAMHTTQVFGTLQAYSFLTRIGKTADFTMHPLVQLATRNWLDSQNAIQRWSGISLRVTADIFTSNPSAYVLHAVAALEYANIDDPYDKEAEERLLYDVKNYLRTILGIKHPVTLQAMHDLGAVYNKQGRHLEAEALYREIVNIRKEALGPVHRHTVDAMFNLAATYRLRERFAEAESLFTQILGIQQQEVGYESLDAAKTLLNLASIYMSQGYHTQAEPLLTQVLVIQKRELGSDHLDTVDTMHYLAGIYCSSGRLAEAEAFFDLELPVRKQKLGIDHLDTTRAMYGLATIYILQGRQAEAEPFLIQVLAIRQEKLGMTHPDTVTAIKLALSYSAQNRYMEAEPLQTQVLATREEKLGVAHTDTMEAMFYLAVSLSMQQKYTEAEALLNHLVEIRKATPEIDILETAEAMYYLAALYSEQGRYVEAETLLVQVVSVRKEKLTETHVDTLEAMQHLAVAYSEQRRYAEAESLQVQVLESRRRILGLDHRDTIEAMHNLAVTYGGQGRIEEEKEMLQDVVEASMRTLGESHPDTVGRKRVLAERLREGRKCGCMLM